MRLSQRADYAAHAMVEIARWYGERPVHATEIAQRQGIPEPYLEQLLLALRRAALVRSYRGPGGGYRDHADALVSVQRRGQRPLARAQREVGQTHGQLGAGPDLRRDGDGQGAGGPHHS